jgi:hypothetical protein
MRIVKRGQDVFVHKEIMSAAKVVEFVNDRLLRGRWCNVVVVNVHAPTEYEIDGTQKRFYEELEGALYNFIYYHMKIFLGVFSARVGRENIF